MIQYIEFAEKTAIAKYKNSIYISTQNSEKYEFNFFENNLNLVTKSIIKKNNLDIKRVFVVNGEIFIFDDFLFRVIKEDI